MISPCPFPLSDFWLLSTFEFPPQGFSRARWSIAEPVLAKTARFPVIGG
ncbi:MAG TPA: hypothetical protein VMU04_03150 [Candidatus Acidoferrum sp.]|nr:hypothetical protein [Candidatus Acidoferrum sp.]